jgi:hypothetical protein
MCSWGGRGWPPYLPEQRRPTIRDDPEEAGGALGNHEQRASLARPNWGFRGAYDSAAADFDRPRDEGGRRSMKPPLLEMAVVVLTAAVTACATGRSSPADGAGLDTEPRRIECPSEHRDRNGWDGVTFRFTVLPNGTVDARSVRLHPRPGRQGELAGHCGAGRAGSPSVLIRAGEIERSARFGGHDHAGSGRAALSMRHRTEAKGHDPHPAETG